MLIFEMMVGAPPFNAETQIETYHRILKGKYKVPADFSKVRSGERMGERMRVRMKC